MPVFYDGAFIRVKSQKPLKLFSQKIPIIYIWKGSKHNSAAVSISCIITKKTWGNTLTWNISWIWFLTTQNTLIYQRHSLSFRINLFAIYFPLKPVLFTVHILLIRTFSLYQTKVIFAFIKRIDVDHYYHKCAIEY